MAEDLTADELRALLKLEPSQTCGFVRETYLSALQIAPEDCRRRSPMGGL